MRTHSARVEFFLGQQAGQQFLRYFVIFGCHCVCGQAGSCLRGNGCTEAQHPFLTESLDVRSSPSPPPVQPPRYLCIELTHSQCDLPADILNWRVIRKARTIRSQPHEDSRLIGVPHSCRPTLLLDSIQLMIIIIIMNATFHR